MSRIAFLLKNTNIRSEVIVSQRSTREEWRVLWDGRPICYCVTPGQAERVKRELDLLGERISKGELEDDPVTPVEGDEMMNKEFEVHMLNDDGKDKAQIIAQAFNDCLERLAQVCPSGREMALVRTNMEIACFFAKKAMASLVENQVKSEP